MAFSSYRALVLISVAVLIASALAAKTRAATPLEIRLRDGRIVKGEIAPRSSATHLWLRGGDDEIAIESGFPWSQLQSVTMEGKPLFAADLRALFQRETATKSPVPLPTPQAPWTQQRVEAFPVTSDVTANIRSLYIDVSLARWNAFVPTSGLAVTMMPLDGAGALLPIRGDLTLTVYANIWGGSRSSDDRNGMRELARAYHLIRPEAFDHGPPTFQIPFEGDHPELDQRVEPYGLVHARLGVNGQGVFEASDGFVRLRPYSPLRDHRNQFGQPRFLPIESTGWPHR
jgi:hypothetical protein